MMELTTRDLGVQVDQWTYRREVHAYAVDGLPNGGKAMILEENGVFTAHLLNVNKAIGETSRRHDSLESALNELRELHP